MTWTKRILSYVLIFVPDDNAKISNRVDLAKDDEVKSTRKVRVKVTADFKTQF